MVVKIQKRRSRVTYGLLLILCLFGISAPFDTSINVSAKRAGQEEKIQVYQVMDEEGNVLSQKAMITPSTTVALEEGQTGMITAKIDLFVMEQDMKSVKQQVSENEPLLVSLCIPKSPFIQYAKKEDVDRIELSMRIPDFKYKDQNFVISNIRMPKDIAVTGKKQIVFRLVDQSGIEQYALFFQDIRSMEREVYLTVDRQDKLPDDLLLAIGRLGVYRSKEITSISFYGGREENHVESARVLIDPMKERPQDSIVYCYSYIQDKKSLKYQIAYLYSCQIDRNGAILIPYKGEGNIVILNQFYQVE